MTCNVDLMSCGQLVRTINITFTNLVYVYVYVYIYIYPYVYVYIHMDRQRLLCSSEAFIIITKNVNTLLK